MLEGLLEFEATGIVESWLRLFLFSLLFGLSIDYEMFVMGRIQELKEQGLSTDEAISAGMKGTAAVITNAAAIMVAVALIFAFMRDLGMKQFGFGLAVAIFFDATVIRTFAAHLHEATGRVELVPAPMAGMAPNPPHVRRCARATPVCLF